MLSLFSSIATFLQRCHFSATVCLPFMQSLSYHTVPSLSYMLRRRLMKTYTDCADSYWIHSTLLFSHCLTPLACGASIVFNSLLSPLPLSPSAPRFRLTVATLFTVRVFIYEACPIGSPLHELIERTHASAYTHSTLSSSKKCAPGICYLFCSPPSPPLSSNTCCN